MLADTKQDAARLWLISFAFFSLDRVVSLCCVLFSEIAEVHSAFWHPAEYNSAIPGKVLDESPQNH